MTPQLRPYFAELADRFGNGWNRFWFAPSDPAPLCLVRLLVGTIGLAWYLTLWPDLFTLFGPDGLLSIQFAKEWRTGIISFSLFDYADSTSSLTFTYCVGAAALAALAAGLFTRIAAVASLVVVLSVLHRGPMLARPADDVLAMLTLYLCIGPAGARSSIDAWLRRKRQSSSLPPPAVRPSWSATLATRLIQVHLALVVGAMATAQLKGAAWWDGTAVWSLLARTDSRLVDLTFLGNSIYVINAATHAVLLFEICFALLIWNRLARPPLLIAGCLVWTFLALATGMLTFFLLLFAASLVFLPPEALGLRDRGPGTGAVVS